MAKFRIRPSGTAGQQAAGEALGRFVTSRVGQGLPRWQGPFTAPLTGMQQSALGGIGSYLTSPTFGAQSAAYRGALSGQPAWSYDPAETSRLFGEAYAPTRQRFYEEGIPAIGEAFAGPGGGYWSSARAQAQERGIGEFEQALGAEEAQWHRQDIVGERGAQESAAGRALQAAGMESPEMRAYQTQVQAGELQRALQQQDLDRRIQSWMQSLPELNPILGIIQQYISTPLTYGYFRDSGGGADMLGSAGSLAGMGLGALLAAPTGGLSMPMGAALGGMLGGGGGSAMGTLLGGG